MNRNKRDAIIMFVAAAIFIVVSILSLAKETKFSRGERADATITQIISYTSGDDLEHEVTVEFTTADGQVISGILDSYSSSFYEGKVIPVKYMPDDPHDFTYAKGSYLILIIFAAAGVLLVGAGVFKLVRGGDDDGSGELRGKIDDSQKDNW